MTLALLLTACAQTEHHHPIDYDRVDRLYDSEGKFAGHIDKTGRIYDRDGNYAGMIRK
jgi:hypothetical protein